MMDEQQALNSPYIVEWNGRQLRFGGLNQNVKAACVSAAKLAARLEHAENMETFYGDGPSDSPEQKKKKAGSRAAEDAEFKTNLITGQWGWDGDLRRAWQRGSKGVKTFISALLDAGGTPLTDDEIGQLVEAKPQEVLAILALVDWDISNPKQKRPARLARMEAIANPLRLQTSMPHSSEVNGKAEKV